MKSEKGQVVVLIALIIIGLMGAMALAIDGSMIMFDRRNAQSAADASTLAGAYELSKYYGENITARTSRIKNAAIARAADNGYTITASDVEYPPASGTFQVVNGDTNPLNYIRVTIHSTVDTSFVHLIGFSNAITNKVVAVTHISPAINTASFALIALAPVGCGDYGGMNMGGGGTVSITGGGVLVNSTATGSGGCFGLEMSLNSTLNTNGNSTYVVGSNDGQGTISPPLYTNSPIFALSFPPPGAPPYPPSTQGLCTGNAVITTATTVYNGNTYRIMTPGIAPVDFNKTYNIWMNPGVYCFSNGMSISNKMVYGDGVMLYITPQPNKFEVSMLGSSNFILKHYTSEPYKGMVLFIDPNNYAPASYNYCTLLMSGSSGFFVDGTIYAPMCTIQIGGSTESTIGAQVLGYKIVLQGGTTFNVNSTSGDNYAKIPLPGSVDLSQ
ncbi:MAG: hypothetical protein C0391_00750 [Anaerolinea sp.]|nr:hypothetical protein [Anaerolinea sp.]